MPDLRGRQIRCRGCRSVLSIASDSSSIRIVPLPEADSGTAEAAEELALSAVGDAQIMETDEDGPWESGPAAKDVETEPDEGATAVADEDAAEAVQETKPAAAAEEEKGEEETPEAAEQDGKAAARRRAREKLRRRAERPLWREPSRGRTRPSKGEGWSMPAIPLAYVKYAAYACVGVGVVLVARHVFLRWGGIEKAAYLPASANGYVAMKPHELFSSHAYRLSSGARPVPLADRCGKFLENAGIDPHRVIQVWVGRAATGESAIAVYELADPVDPDEVMRKKPFRRWENTEQKETRIGGQRVFVVGPSAFAFPRPNLVVTGLEADMAEALSNPQGKVGDPLKTLIPQLDLTRTLVAISPGIPREFAENKLDGQDDLTSQVVATTDEAEYSSKMQLSRTIHLADEAAAERFQAVVREKLDAARDAAGREGEVGKALRAIALSRRGATVRLEATLLPEALTPAAVHAVNAWF